VQKRTAQVTSVSQKIIPSHLKCDHSNIGKKIARKCAIVPKLKLPFYRQHFKTRR